MDEHAVSPNVLLIECLGLIMNENECFTQS